jgi:hypothetical protein
VTSYPVPRWVLNSELPTSYERMHESHGVQNEESIEFGGVGVEGGGVINAGVSDIRDVRCEAKGRSGIVVTHTSVGAATEVGGARAGRKL